MSTIPNNESSEPAAAPATPAAGGALGKRLREARLAAQLDVPEVARRLHLDTAIIEALERDDYGRLPPPAFVRGYVRAYARLLGLPADPLIALYERSGAAQDPPLAVHTPVRVQARSGDRRVRWITYVIVVLLGALFFAWWRNESSFKFWQSPPAAAVTEGSVASPHAAASSAPAAHGPASVARQAPKPPAAASAAAPQAVLPTLPGMKLATRPRLPAPNSSSAATTASPPAAAPVPATGAHAAGRSGPAPHGTLTVRVDGECWVSIYDATGKRLVYALLLAGNARTVTGQPPFQVVLGNAPVAHVEYDGRPYDLSRFAHVRYARLKVGAAQGSGVIPGQ